MTMKTPCPICLQDYDVCMCPHNKLLNMVDYISRQNAPEEPSKESAIALMKLIGQAVEKTDVIVVLRINARFNDDDQDVVIMDVASCSTTEDADEAVKNIASAMTTIINTL